MQDDGDGEVRRAGALVGLIDRLIPPELHVDADSQLRSRVLVVGSAGIGVVTLVALLVRVAAFPYEPGVLIGGAAIGLMLGLPLVQRATRSHRIAGGLMVVVLMLALPVLHLLRGVFPDPTAPIFATVPPIAAFFVGPRFGFVVAAILSAEVVALQAVLDAASKAEIAEFWWAYVALTAAAPLMSAVLAAAYERARAQTQGRLADANRALVAASARAEAANRGKTEFLRHVSHELRTPLNSIIGYSELALEQLRDERHPLTDDVEKIRGASVQLLGLINDLLDLSRVEAGAVDVVVTEVDPRAVLAQVRDTALPLAAVNHNTITLAVPEALPRLSTDEQRLRQILLNLVSNACKFTDRGRVDIVAEATADALLVRVRDTGVGLTAEARARIFAPFVQVHASAERRSLGTGLGLALSRELARRLGGDISVESEPGRGSQFTLQLPLRPPPDG